MNKKLNKKDLLVSAGNPIYIRHPRNDVHNEVTVVVLKLAIPLEPITGGIVSSQMIKDIEKVATGFPETNLRFNYNPKAPAVLFTVKGKTECRGNDTPDQRIGDAVALAKAQGKAATVASKVLAAVSSALFDAYDAANNAAYYLYRFAVQEKAYVAEEKYMKVLEKKKKKEEN